MFYVASHPVFTADNAGTYVVVPYSSITLAQKYCCNVLLIATATAVVYSVSYT